MNVASPPPLSGVDSSFLRIAVPQVPPVAPSLRSTISAARTLLAALVLACVAFAGCSSDLYGTMSRRERIARTLDSLDVALQHRRIRGEPLDDLERRVAALRDSLNSPETRDGHGDASAPVTEDGSRFSSMVTSLAVLLLIVALVLFVAMLRGRSGAAEDEPMGQVPEPPEPAQAPYPPVSPDDAVEVIRTRITGKQPVIRADTAVTDEPEPAPTADPEHPPVESTPAPPTASETPSPASARTVAVDEGTAEKPDTLFPSTPTPPPTPTADSTHRAPAVTSRPKSAPELKAPSPPASPTPDLSQPQQSEPKRKTARPEPEPEPGRPEKASAAPRDRTALRPETKPARNKPTHPAAKDPEPAPDAGARPAGSTPSASRRASDSGSGDVRSRVIAAADTGQSPDAIAAALGLSPDHVRLILRVAGH